MTEAEAYKWLERQRFATVYIGSNGIVLRVRMYNGRFEDMDRYTGSTILECIEKANWAIKSID